MFCVAVRPLVIASCYQVFRKRTIRNTFTLAVKQEQNRSNTAAVP
jgi:hypothetical protein